MAGRIGWTVGLLGLLAVVLGGCGGGTGGGSEPESVAQSASVQGTVYAPSVSAAAAGQGQTGSPAGDCQVTARRLRDGKSLGTTRTDGAGRYRLQGLPAGEEAVIDAVLRTGERLRTRLRLQDGSCTANVDEDTTMAAACRELLDGASEEPEGTEALDEELIEGLCNQYQTRHRYQYGGLGGRRPDLTSPEAQAGAADELLVAAGNAAVERARTARSESNCLAAIQMAMACLRAGEAMGYTWDEETQRTMARAMAEGRVLQVRDVAAVASRVMDGTVSEGDLLQLRRQLRQRLEAFAGDAMDPLQAMACLSLRHQATNRAPAASREQARECLQALLAE